MNDPEDHGPAFLLSQPAGRAERQRALAVLLASAVIFCVLAPWAKLPLTPVAAFIPIYQSALVLIDLITAVLLFGQFRILRSRALLVLGCGYLFTALMALGHMASLPWPLRAGGPARRGAAEHGLDLHVLAQRLPAVRAGLCRAQARRTARTAAQAAWLTTPVHWPHRR